MRTISGNLEIDYSMTPGGSMVEKHTLGNMVFIRSTKDPEQFLRWMIASEVNKVYRRQVEQARRRVLISLLKPLWEKATEESRPGHFNEDLYFKIIKAKIDNGTLEF